MITAEIFRRFSAVSPARPRSTLHCPLPVQSLVRLDRVMADRKMSLNELSEKVGVANVNLSKMKNGHISAIRFSTLAAICDVLQCQPGDILEYSPEE